MVENQRTVFEWAEKTFGRCSPQIAIDRMFEEIDELAAYREEPTTRKDAVAMRGECADVIITMYRVAEMLDFDLHAAVDSKMSLNRDRKWRTTPHGVGYHV
jgi:NTP pyrophosphatase (non-canonical NTP hydrolase)